MAKKHKHEGHVNHERWLVSYADFITLLFAFFVVMYAISDLNSRKAKQVSQSVRFAMHFMGSGGTNEPGMFAGRAIDPSALQSGGAMGSLEQWMRESTTVYEFVAKEFQEELATSEDATKGLDERGVVIAMPAAWLFAPGSTRPNDRAEKDLKKLLETAKKFHKDVMISGTTACVVYEEGNKYRDSVDLQIARLRSLERVAIDQLQFPQDRIEVRWQTKKDPAGSYASPAQVERSARIEFVVKR